MTKDNSTGKPKDFYSRGQQMFDSLNLPDDDDDTQVYTKPWAGLTDDDWVKIDNKKDTALDSFAQGAVWAEDQLRKRNT